MEVQIAFGLKRQGYVKYIRFDCLKLLLPSLLLILFSAPDLYAQAQRAANRNKAAAIVYSPHRKGTVIDFSAFYSLNETSSKPADPSDSSSKASSLDIKLGYINQAAFYWGVGYTFKTDELQAAQTTGRGSGFGFGYYWSNGFDLKTFYRFQESYGNFSKGDGYQVNLSYSSKISSMLNIGFNLDYREIKYLDFLDTPEFDARLMKTVQPSVALSIYFE